MHGFLPGRLPTQVALSILAHRISNWDGTRMSFREPGGRPRVTANNNESRHPAPCLRGGTQPNTGSSSSFRGLMVDGLGRPTCVAPWLSSTGGQPDRVYPYRFIGFGWDLQPERGEGAV